MLVLYRTAEMDINNRFQPQTSKWSLLEVGLCLVSNPEFPKLLIRLGFGLQVWNNLTETKTQNLNVQDD